MRRAAGEYADLRRPFVTLSYAQSLDGSISRRRGEPFAISGRETLKMTHALRAEHDAILVGRGTIQADDPQMTVRLAEGDSPRPVILDSRLTCPPGARIFKHPKAPWLVAGAGVDAGRVESIEGAGGVVIPVSLGADARVDLTAALEALAERGVGRLMVEGGAEVITSFLEQGAADILIITIAPVLLGGLKGVGDLTGSAPPNLEGMQVERYGDDIVVWGRLA